MRLLVSLEAGLSDENRVSGCDRGMAEGMDGRGKGPRTGWARIQAQPALGPTRPCDGRPLSAGYETEAGVPVPRCWGCLRRSAGQWLVPGTLGLTGALVIGRERRGVVYRRSDGLKLPHMAAT